jgi:hypothetical protein
MFRSSRRPGGSRRYRSGLLLLAPALLAGCAHRLPEQGSPVMQLYLSRCGSCHQAYDPRSLTSSMWEVQMAAMGPKIAAAGQPPLTADEQRAILDYLRRNAGG